MCHIIGCLVFFSEIVLFPFLLFNPKNVNEKATDEAYNVNDVYYIIV